VLSYDHYTVPHTRLYFFHLLEELIILSSLSCFRFNIVPYSGVLLTVLRGIAYNSSNEGKCANTNEIVTTGSTENCESEKVNAEVANDKKVSFDNVTNVD